MSGPVYPYRDDRWWDGKRDRDGDYIRFVGDEPVKRVVVRYGGAMVGRQLLRPVSEKAMLATLRRAFYPEGREAFVRDFDQRHGLTLAPEPVGSIDRKPNRWWR